MMKQTINRLDQTVTQWVASVFGQSARPFFEFMTLLGDPITITLISVGLLASAFYTSSVRLALTGIAIPATVIIGALLKLAFERARPMTEYAMNMKLKTFSFPSGHSSGSTIAFGILAYLAFMKLPAPYNVIIGSLLCMIPLFVGISRVYLGAHFPSDVIAGWLLGLVALVFVVFVIRPLS